MRKRTFYIIVALCVVSLLQSALLFYFSYQGLHYNRADINRDGKVDGLDVSLVLNDFER